MPPTQAVAIADIHNGSTRLARLAGYWCSTATSCVRLDSMAALNIETLKNEGYGGRNRGSSRQDRWEREASAK